MGDTHIDVRSDEGHCGTASCREITDTLSLIGDKWTVMIVATLSMDSPLRYNVLHRRVEGISQRMLTLTLRNLEQDGLVQRTIYPDIPPRVEYALTELGQHLVPPLRALYDWAGLHRKTMMDARARFTARKAKAAAKAVALPRTDHKGVGAPGPRPR